VWRGGCQTSFQDKLPQILNCRIAFTFSAGERDFYLSCGSLNESRRCPKPSETIKQSILAMAGTVTNPSGKFFRLLDSPQQGGRKQRNKNTKMATIYFVGTYKPIMCGIADYTSFVAREIPAGRWGVISFDLKRYGEPLITDDEAVTGRVWYGIPSRHEFSAPVIMQGLKKLGAKNEGAVLWFQHENGIWPGNMQFIAMLKNLNIPKVVTFHTLHFQSSETPTGLRRNQYELLQILLPYVDAITVFSRGVYHAVTSAFPEHRDKVYILEHGIHSYPGISRLSRQEAKEKLNDFLLYESGLDRETKETLYKQRVFLDSDTVVVGQTGFLSPSKNSELLYAARDSLQKAIPHNRIIAVRIGSSRDELQRVYAANLRRRSNGRDKFLFEVWLPENTLALVQRAFDINFYWPRECTQSGLLAHALGVGAVIAGRDLEGVGETLKRAGELTSTSLKRLLLMTRDLLSNRELREELEKRVLEYTKEFSWRKQARKHYELAEHILSAVPG
jgi:glycosyltransferase involved in cell wall biosynthesis